MLKRFHFSPVFGSALAIATVFAACTAEAGTITITESVTPLALSGFSAINLTNAPLGDAASYTVAGQTISFNGLASNQGVVTGSSPGLYAAPDTNAAGATYAQKYLSTGAGGYINIAFSTAHNQLALLWGTVDPSNEIAFLNGSQVVGMVTGADIEAAEHGSDAGSEYVKLVSSINFNDIQISSGVVSFEAASLDYATATTTNVHEPASLALFGVGLLGLMTLRRRS